MSKPKVSVVDYGIGNLFSVQRALEYCGASVQTVTSQEGIEAAERLILPGVGAFADGMRGLQEQRLVEPLLRFASSGRAILGICLGMQMLASFSEEFGEHEGLGLIPGRVKGVPRTTVDGITHKIPHIGWSEISSSNGVSWIGTMLEDTAAFTPVYLVHSFHLVPDSPAHLLAGCSYGGHSITAAVRSGKIFGAQFHPEKSGREGLKMLAAFLRL